MLIRPPQGPAASALRVDDLSKLPPAMVLLAENDLLHDKGQAYIERMTSAGVTACTKLHQDKIHCFVAT
ncbi:alpha/beta hydrolase fold domain-containing protein [Zhongshania sp. BJYM1]|uniref:alpha/beta hydrolase fold domain-containing protein n=1 Tax=Zhongshania aquatica TaxID=2965069 RepID=UPI003312FDF0